MHIFDKKYLDFLVKLTESAYSETVLQQLFKKPVEEEHFTC